MNKLIICLIFIRVTFAFSQVKEEISFNYETGKGRLLKENIQLMAEYYNLDIAEAQVLQAGLWENPTFVWNAEIYSIAQNKYFQFNNQKLIQLEYVLSVSGKRINAVKEAKIAKEIATYALSDVIRALVLEYSDTFYNLISLQETNDVLNQSLVQYDNLILLCSKGKELGIKTESELVRLKSERQSILSSINSNELELLQAELNMRKLLNYSESTLLKPIKSIQQILPNQPLDTLIKISLENRPDLQIARKNIQLYQANLKTEKSNAVPSMKLGYQPLDGGSNYVRPYSGMVWEMGIPIFNRNQGKIAEAKIRIEQEKLLLTYKTDEVIKEVNVANESLLRAVKLKESFNNELLSDMEKLYVNATKNFENRNITLYEFIDFQRIYLQNRMDYIQASKNLNETLNLLNFSIGLDLTNF
jgi:cobalt-zinc-cadmium efflux system outer membrane protein